MTERAVNQSRHGLGNRAGRKQLSRQIQVHVGIERELGAVQPGAYSGWVITGAPVDIHVQGTDPEDVRKKLRDAVLQEAQAGKLSLELPPRSWTEALEVTLPEESAQNVDFNG